MLTLVISHYIYLTKQQRYDLHGGQTIETCGVSIPVWFDKGNTSEPAREIFCRYILKNIKEHKAVEVLRNGYEINLPQPIHPVNQSGEKINKKNYFNQDRAVKLLDVEDGGAKWLEFKQYSTMKFKKKKVDVVHSIEIKDISILDNSLD